MHDWLFANQNAWANSQDAAGQLRTQALTLDLDEAKYDACIADPQTQAAMQKDMTDGAAKGVRGTPAFFLSKVDAQGVEGETRPLTGAVPYEQFAEAIQALLGE
jgi:protein-disulfide isomerase